MKNKKLICIVGIFIVLMVCGVCFFLLKKDSSLEKGKILNIKRNYCWRSSHHFRTVILGDYTGLFVNGDVEKIKAYEFDATIDNGWSVETDQYVGIRVKDAFEYLSIDQL